jgi:cob(I)alamin adenosyltransferase
MPSVKREKLTTQLRFRPLDRGLTIAYVGNGKGKTTAAVGLAVRAAGYKKRVLFFQFFKSPSWPSGERESLKKLGVKVKVLGKGFVGILGDRKPKAEHRAATQAALVKAEKYLESGKFDVIVLDEIISCVEVGLLSVAEIVALLVQKSKDMHVVITGHKRYAAIIKLCDVVSEMKMVKHPYYRGFLATQGIDY